MESREPSLVLGRYIGAMDRVVAGQDELDQLLELFAANAVVDLDGTPAQAMVGNGRNGSARPARAAGR